MAASTATFAGGDAMDAEALLVDDAVRGSVDYKNRPVLRSKTGCWKSASFMIGVEMAERFAYYGISSNLVIYLTGPLGQSTAAAAANVNAWSATASLSPLLGAFVADSFLGRFRTIIAASLLYILGLGLLSVSAALNSSSDSSSPPLIDVFFFFIALYLVAFAVGGHKPCLQAFGADQFDEENGKELQSKSSFFNWWSFCLCVSIVVGLLVLTYIQENLSWELGFGIPCIVMCFALLVFLLGMVTYRFRVKGDERRNPFARITRVFMEAVKNRHANRAGVAVEEEDQSVLPSEGAQFRFLDQAILEPNGEKVCSINDVEDAKAILKLLPICLACLPFTIVYSQSTTLFTKQGTTMDRHITGDFQIPAAALQAFTPGSIILFVPFYEHVLIPIARAIGHKPSLLQRIGSGLFLGIVCMAIAGFTETKRFETAREHGLVDSPEESVPMSVWWLVPQYLVMGIADVLTFVGLQEFFYDQVPGELKSMGLALSFCVAGVGGFLSSFLVSLVDTATGGRGGASWLSDNLNRAHLDYFYWLLAGINVLSLVLYVYFAKSYVYSKRIIV